jgi:hypothetical protein
MEYNKRFYIYDCTGKLVGNILGYKTMKGAETYANNGLRGMLYDVARDNKSELIHSIIRGDKRPGVIWKPAQ